MSLAIDFSDKIKATIEKLKYYLLCLQLPKF